ncbi:MAG: hypothetical protein K8T20_19025, partial [Planctomycetes bacterium]|nr:hypothetical protein [Planctomycetota bacterium]
GKVVAHADLTALPTATTADLLDARDWLVELARTNDGHADVGPIEAEIARRPFDPAGDRDVEAAAEDVVREMIMDAIVDLAPRQLFPYLLVHSELMALVKAVAERSDVPPLSLNAPAARSRPSTRLPALRGKRAALARLVHGRSPHAGDPAFTSSAHGPA